MKSFFLAIMTLSIPLLTTDRGEISEQPPLSGSSPQLEKVSWNRLEEMIARDEPLTGQKVVMKVYTNWCTWCQRMESSTFGNPSIASYLNRNFLPVKFNAEYPEAVAYKGKTYQYVKNGKRGHHELAAHLLRGRMSYPTVVFLDEKGEIIQSIVGYKTPEQFELILVYFADDHYKDTPWSVFQREYQHRLVKE